MSFDPRDPPDPYEEPNAGRRGRTPPDPRAPRDPYEYRDPLDSAGGASERQKQAARGMVVGPAIFLIIVGVLNLLSAAGYLFLSFAVHSVPASQLEAQMKQDKEKQKQVEELKKANISVQDIQTWEVWGFLIAGVVSVLFGIVILIGGVCMLGQKMWGLSVFASVLALLSPGGCCIFGLIAGIWGLIALLNADVRAAFR